MTHSNVKLVTKNAQSPVIYKGSELEPGQVYECITGNDKDHNVLGISIGDLVYVIKTPNGPEGSFKGNKILFNLYNLTCYTPDSPFFRYVLRNDVTKIEVTIEYPCPRGQD